MRTNTLRQLARSSRSLSHEVTATRISQAPFICASCRTSLQQRQPSHPLKRNNRTRHFTTTPPQHQAKEQAPTHYDLFPQTFPSGAPPTSPFTPNLKDLRKEFLQLQAKAHPDLAPPDQKRQAEAISSRINEAYKTLQDPLRRAQYLLAQQGIDVEDESAKLEEGELLMEVMEAREAVEEAESEEEVLELRQENNGRIEASVKVLEAAFANGNLDEAAQEAIRLRYWMNIEESIQGWEKGKGGGILHH